MSFDNIVSFKANVLRKDLEEYSKALFKQVMFLQIQNAALEAKIEHLEELLQHANIPIIGEK